MNTTTTTNETTATRDEVKTGDFYVSTVVRSDWTSATFYKVLSRTGDNVQVQEWGKRYLDQEFVAGGYLLIPADEPVTWSTWTQEWDADAAQWKSSAVVHQAPAQTAQLQHDSGLRLSEGDTAYPWCGSPLFL